MTTTELRTYEFRVDGHLDDHWASRLGDLVITRHDNGSTTLTGPVADQAQLHGLLAGLRDIGATLLSVCATEPTEDDQPRYTGRTPTVRPILEHELPTERLWLRPATAGDADATWRYRRLDSVNEWLAGAPADIAAYRSLFTEPARLATTVIVQPRDSTGQQIIGDFMLRREDAWAQTDVADQARGAQAELGWVLDPTFTGHGYATEAVRELLRYCFDDLGVHRVIANCFLDNNDSLRLMQRVGMRRETHAVRESLHRSGRWLDTVVYAVLADEWHQ